MASLYEQDAAAWDRMGKSGRPALRDMAGHFSEFYEMEQALGFGHSVIKKWVAGGNPSQTAERRAAAWLRDRAIVAPPAPAPAAATILCVTPAGKSAQVQKVLRMLGCEIIDIEE